MKIVGIGAHPDDIEIGCGGTILVHKGRIDEMHGILCTLGGIRGDPKEREVEAFKAAEILGMKLHILDFPVARLNKGVNKEFVRILKKTIDDIGPDRIYTHGEYDFHQVHVSVSRSTIEAAKSVNQLLFYETISSTTLDFKPNAYVEISDYVETKIKSIEAHISQYRDRFYLQSNVIRSLANTRYVWGKVGPNPEGMAEAFVIKKFVVDKGRK